MVRGPREVGFMADRQLTGSPRLLALTGSLGQLCTTHSDCLTKHAICTQSGRYNRPLHAGQSTYVKGTAAVIFFVIFWGVFP